MAATQAVRALLVNVPTWVVAVPELSAFRLASSESRSTIINVLRNAISGRYGALRLKPSQIRLKYHKFGLNLFAVAEKADFGQHG